MVLQKQFTYDFKFKDNAKITMCAYKLLCASHKFI